MLAADQRASSVAKKLVAPLGRGRFGGGSVKLRERNFGSARKHVGVSECRSMTRTVSPPGLRHDDGVDQR